MKLKSSRHLPVSQELAWQALNDLDVLKRCIPGCESLVQAEDGTLEAVVVTRIGPVSARFGGKVTLADVVPPTSYRLVFAGQGGAAGFAKGEARVNLAAQSPTATELHYTAEAAVGGKLAQVGSRLIESSAKKLAEEFFTRFEAALAPPTVELAAPEIGGIKAHAPAPAPVSSAPSTSWSGRPHLWIIVSIAAIIAAIAIYLN